MARLAENHYGKSRVRLVKVTRHADHHDLLEWNVGVYLTGDFEACFLEGDNTGLLATDTMKNTVYSLARTSTATTMEAFGIELAEFLAGRDAALRSVRVTVEEKMWVRLRAAGADGAVGKHASAFLQRGPDVATTEVVLTRGEGAGVTVQVTSGVKGLVILKTAQSAFAGFRRDELTTLPDSYDRLLGTEATITWRYAGPPGDFAATRAGVMDVLLTTFANHESLSVQHTLYAMAEAALNAEPLLAEMELTMPNRHNIPVDLQKFGQDNPNTIFVPMDEPHGLIHARWRGRAI